LELNSGLPCRSGRNTAFGTNAKGNGMQKKINSSAKMVATVTLALAATIPAQSGAAAAPLPVCRPVSGLSDAVKSTKPRILVFGEVHGTSEIPEFFADAICQLSETRPILVLLEFDQHDGELLDRYIHGDPRVTTAVLVSTGVWAERRRDGRTSKAMLSMIGRLRKLALAGRKLAVTGIVPTDNFELPQKYYELGIANEIRRATATHKDSAVLVLIGNLHARKTALPEMASVRPAISLLPPDDVLSLRNDIASGHAWNCQTDGCHEHETVPPTPLHPRGIVVDAKANEGYDGFFSVGQDYTASSPATVPIKK
jgi:hypothetical protein